MNLYVYVDLMLKIISKIWNLILNRYLCIRHQKFFSCLFVKFVLYTAGFLGEGTLLILSPSHYVTAPGGMGALSPFPYFALQNTRAGRGVCGRPRFALILSPSHCVTAPGGIGALSPFPYFALQNTRAGRGV